MTEFARLGIAVDSRPVVRAKDDLTGFVRAGRNASDAADDLGRSTGRARDQFGRFVKGGKQATHAARDFDAGAASAKKTVSALGQAIGAVAVGLAGFASAQEAVAQARGFSAAMSEVSTLIEGTRLEMSFLQDEAMRMAGTFGGTATDQVKAFYQAISAGADSVEAAAQILDQSNRLAIGGVTDVTTGVDALTTAVNAFRDTGLTAAEASDAMFIGMKAGKTTIAELSAQMGQIVPIASAAGVSFDEMIAGISALTTQGQSTATATTGLRAAITGILQPSKQAADAAKSLGLEFSASALQAKGLEQFLADVVRETGGSTDALTQLFGSVEALNAVLAFSGAAGQTFTDIMGEMGDKAGATDEAFSRVASGVDQRLNAAFGRFTVLATQFGEVLLQVGVPAVEALASVAGVLSDNFNAVIGIVSATGVAIASTYAPAAYGAVTATAAWVASLVTLRGALMATGIGALVVGAGVLIGKFLDLVKTTGGWGSALELLGDVASGVWEGIKTSASAIPMALEGEWELVKSDFLNLMATLSARWRDFLEMMGASGAAANQAAKDFTDASAAAAGRAGRLFSEASEAFTSGFDAAREAAAKLRVQVEGTAVSTDAGADAADELAKALAKLGKGTEKAAKGLGKAKSEAEAFADALEDAALTAEDMGKAKADILVSGIGGVSDAWGEFISRGFSDFKGFAKSVVDSFKRMLAQMVALAARNRIMISLSLGGAGVGGAAQAASGAAGGAAGVGNLLGIGGTGIAGLASSGGILGAVGGFASGIGGILSGGGLGASAATLGGLVTGSVGVTAGALGAAIPVLGAVAAAVSFFSSKTKHLDNGLRVTANNVDTLVEEFDKIQKSRFWGLSKKVRLTFREADEATAAPIRKSIADITGAIGLAGEQLGLTADNFDSWSTQIQVSLKGLDEAAKNAEIQRIFDTVAEQFSYAALGHFNEVLGGTLIREGETAADTLDALVVSLSTANNALDLLNGTLFDASVYGANMARHLTDALGGVENFNTAVNTYFTNFYSQEEQLASRTGLLADQFDALNVTMPKTREEFRALVEAQDLSTAGGRELYAGLLSVSGEFANLTRLSEDLYGSATLAASGISALVRSFSTDALAAEDELAQAQATALVEYRNVMRIMDLQIRSAQSARDSIKSIFDILADGLDARGVLELEVQKIRRDSLQSELAAGISDPQRLRKVIQDLNSPSQQFFSSYSDFAYDYYRTSALIGEQKDVAEDQLSEAEKQLRALEDQKKSIEELYGPLLGIDQNTDNLEEAMERLEAAMLGVEAAMLRVEDSMYALAQALLSAVSGIGGTGGLMGMGKDAFDQFSFDRTNGILSDMGAGVLDGVAGQINNLYQDVFGRNVDVAGLDFYGDLLQSGQVKAGRIQYDLMTSGEAQTGVTPGFGNIGSAAQPVDPVEALYGSMLGRAADPAGVEFWKSTGLQGEALINAFRDGALAAGDVPSFDGGGYTGSGPRVGGLDGKGGFLAMLHPQETVEDHTRSNRSGGQTKGDSSAVVQELRKIGDRLAVLESHARATTYNTGKSMRTQTKWDRDGVPKERTE
ncbi:phage tail tape measure protein [Rhodobacteraceae bacterium R_SAG2]|nr:phage tail tape measure protein [Rhodobacteraceae bacterium R_SAG2]